MKGQLNPRIIGSLLVGFGLVAGAYTISSLTDPKEPTTQQANIVSSATTPRTIITIEDSDENGIEDWRDDFVTASPVILDDESLNYTPPDTLTGQLGIDFMEGIIRSKVYGPFGQTSDEVVENTVKRLSEEAKVELYDLKDVDVLNEWDDQDIANYANTAAAVILSVKGTSTENEIFILKDILENNNQERIEELETISSVYLTYRNDTLNIPVPKLLVKEHLDLINTYNAIYNDVIAMQQALSDPAVTLLHLKRYQDDATGLGYALQNMFFAVSKTSALFEEDDPATFFTVFSPDYQS